jgi:serpin B
MSWSSARARARWLPVKAAVLFIALLPGFFSGYGAASAEKVSPARDRQGVPDLVTSVKGTAPPTGPGQVGVVAADEQAFALDLLGRLRPGPANLVVSPSSLATLLAMVEPGAAGATAMGIARVLHSTGVTARDQALGWHTLNASLGQQATRDAIALETANEVWLQAGFPVRPSYLDLLAADFGAGLQERDLTGNPSAASRAIDNWVASRTGGHITHLVTPAELRDVVAVVTDAVYLKAPWATPFDGSLTAPAPFHVSVTETRTVMMMSAPMMFDAPVSVSSSLGAAELAYKGGHLSALVLMPPVGQLNDFEDNLTPEGLARIVAGLHRQPVRLQLPRFSVNSALQLRQVLSAMGMSQAFSNSADFDNLSPRALKLAFVVHDAQVKVTEEGTEASAASGGGFAPTAVVPPTTTIVFDHPFLFLVRDNTTGMVLFEAQVTDPLAT